jgi:hypothetical protein
MLEKVQRFCEWYFIVDDKVKSSTHSRLSNVTRVASYFFIAPPLFIGTLYGLSVLINRCFKKHKENPRVATAARHILPQSQRPSTASLKEQDDDREQTQKPVLPQSQRPSTDSLKEQDGDREKKAVTSFKEEFDKLQLSGPETRYNKCRQFCQNVPPELLCEVLRSEDPSCFINEEYICILASYVDDKKIDEIVQAEIRSSAKRKDYRLLARLLISINIVCRVEDYRQDLNDFCHNPDAVQGLISALRKLNDDSRAKIWITTLASNLNKMFPDAHFSQLFLLT